MKKTFQIVLILVLLALIIGGVSRYMSKPKIDKESYQAVTLMNGWTYYGRIKAIADDSITLTNIYYLEQTGGNNPVLELKEFEKVLQSPQDAMYINRDQMVYWYNLNKNGELYKKIEELRKLKEAPAAKAAPSKKK